MNENQRKKQFKPAIAIVVGALLAMLFFTSGARASGVTPQRPTRLVPVGQTVGVKLFADGVLVVDLSEETSPARRAGIRQGDILLQFNGTHITSTEQLKELIEKNGEKSAEIALERGSKMQTLALSPQKGADGVCRLGAYIRDSMAGIGTMTFYDPQSGVFGALGHGVTDVDTGKLMPLERGSIMDASVRAVKRGASGDPGELRGNFDLTHDSGVLYANTNCGIFGTAEQLKIAREQALPIAERGEIREGKATILANISGEEVREYDIEIEKVFSASSDTRNMLLHVTDERLLAAAGGIVQGMSGSPILQNGRLVGAVTHVLVNDATRGYGIFIENMLDAAFWDNAAEQSA